VAPAPLAVLECGEERGQLAPGGDGPGQPGDLAVKACQLGPERRRAVAPIGRRPELVPCLRQRRLERAATELYSRASAGALEYLRMFQIGRELSPHPGPDEVVGKQLSVMFPGRVPLTAKAARLDRLARWRESR